MPRTGQYVQRPGGASHLLNALAMVPGRRYCLMLNRFQRIQLCLDKRLSLEETAQATGHSLGLVQEYLDFMAGYCVPPLADWERKEDLRSSKSGEQR